MQKTESKQQIKVSVVVPVFNASKYLRQNVESLLGQSLKEVEYFFVDDGSTDGSYDILCEYAKKDNRMHVLRNTVKSDGAAMARNLGMERACGKYLQMVDADDYFAVNMLERFFQTAEKHQVDIVICDAFIHSVQENILRKEHWVLDRRNFPTDKPFSPRDYGSTLFQLSAGQPWNKFYRRKFIEDNHIRFFPVRYTDDIVFTVTSMACAKSIITLPERLVHYRANAPGSQSVSVAQGFSEAGWKADDELFKELRKRGLFETYRQTFYEAALRSFRNVMWRLKDERDTIALYNKIRNEKMTEWGLDEQTLASLPVRLGQEWRRIRETDVNEYLAGRKRGLVKGDKAVRINVQNSSCTVPKQEVWKKHPQQMLRGRPKAFWGMEGADWIPFAVSGEDFIVASDSVSLGCFSHGMPVLSVEALLYSTVKHLVLVQGKDYDAVVKRLAAHDFVPGVDILVIDYLTDQFQ